MSGGHWDYFDKRFCLELEEFCSDIKKRFPELSKVLLKKGKTICEIIHAIDYDVCDDSIIEDDTDFEEKSIQKLKDN
ncbi:MAG: hypothetical protein AB1498_04320 [bacterium]